MAEPKIGGEIKLFLQRTYPATSARVFEAWTDAAQIKKWFAPPDTQVPLAEVDLRIGGKYRIGFSGKMVPGLRVATGVYREIHPPRRLVFTYRWEDEPVSTETLVTIDLTDKNGTTELKLTHEHFITEEVRNHHNVGWNGCLDGLAKHL